MKNKLRKIFKNLYKQLRVSFFKFLYGNITLQKKDISKNKIKSSIFKRENSYFFYNLKNTRVYTDGHENVSIIKNNKLIKKISYQQIKGKLVHDRYNQVLKTGTPKIIKKFVGNSLMLAQGASGYNNYSHWLLDIIPRIKIFSFTKKRVDNICLNKPTQLQLETLRIIGYDKINFINSQKYKHILAENLFICTHPNYKTGTIMQAHSKIPTWIIKYVRNQYKFLKIRKKKKIKIFIDRSDSGFSHCRLINNNYIKKYLLRNNFKIVKLSEFSFKQQINLFYNAGLIIGPHGAGLANLIFCKKNTKVIELKPSNHPNIVYQRISLINNLSYKLIKLNPIKGNPNGDMFLDINKLKKLI